MGSSDATRAYQFWIDHETRRRVLQACFILDTFQTVLFGQQPVLMQHGPANSLSLHLGRDMPFPCSSSLWESTSISEWSANAYSSSSDTTSLCQATSIAISSDPNPLDTFQSVLVFSQILMHHRQTPSFLQDHQQFYSNLSTFNHPITSPNICMEFTYHALLAAFHTPIHSLLIVSGESWLHGKKVENKADFQAAKSALRQWVDAGVLGVANIGNADSLTALWHAARLLQLTLRPRTPLPTSSEMSPNLQPSLHLPHESWSIYICTLICWACGLDSGSTTAGSRSTDSSGQTSITSSLPSSTATCPALHSSDTAFTEASSYLEALTSPKFCYPGDLLYLDPDTRGKTDGLLETIRTQKLCGGENGLVNEAEGVLHRLVEKRGRGWAF